MPRAELSIGRSRPVDSINDDPWGRIVAFRPAAQLIISRCVVGERAAIHRAFRRRIPRRPPRSVITPRDRDGIATRRSSSCDDAAVT
ncbi:hypothetical protein RPB_0322 [Rhodopseudomonas palustris HaA2]|uniref:Uncharacterized protein n=1 Tax=Rhodopseudomonas palustris (strain HaA2) TaxID=316058 RepID=Q2J3C7_RHOP2|nr:hypothetical protein RPB_0322 [Rhodopseudomonas palustris HaA2]